MSYQNLDWNFLNYLHLFQNCGKLGVAVVFARFFWGRARRRIERKHLKTIQNGKTKEMQWPVAYCYLLFSALKNGLLLSPPWSQAPYTSLIEMMLNCWFQMWWPSDLRWRRLRLPERPYIVYWDWRREILLTLFRPSFEAEHLLPLTLSNSQKWYLVRTPSDEFGKSCKIAGVTRIRSDFELCCRLMVLSTNWCCFDGGLPTILLV